MIADDFQALFPEVAEVQVMTVSANFVMRAVR